MLLHTYMNGNCEVSLHSDGTKIRRWEGVAEPLFPESIDLKVTNWCDAGCPYCHEQSTTRGVHSDFKNLCKIIEGLMPGVELAIGGGNPLAYPHLEEFLILAKSKGLVCNITVNTKHLERYKDTIEKLQHKELIYGLGISYTDDLLSMIDLGLIDSILNNNVVIHVIAGVNSIDKVRTLPRHLKILVLGYKDFGFGVKYRLNHDITLGRWAYWISSLLRTHHVSFDNLAIRQLNIRRVVDDETWSKYYLGDDGRHTMYVDAVTMSYAVGSTEDRYSIEGRSILECFAEVRRLSKQLYKE